ncbi:hypothetical protein [Kibdelosporangium phytohabitans]|uniref:TIR domain-containing protein n=1 Tax=Kibdelosporangium phytohabitans TaxID=860235 RepID=A0A0N9HP82_9PSEU|nr:hypothetical protein [Kibdelosporangium phytohabitans]ALG06195.1 hypothetical protein AOZ06_03980 [Kibdelosporangium phytohabitans]MBE1465707.1 hypothetical protein [Kibdelosporangium phytohabitans]
MGEVATYDVAVSFAEEQRSAAEEAVNVWRQRGLTVLHGPDQTHEWWAHKEGGDLPDARVRFFLPFVSTLDDFTAAMLHAVKTGNEHVLPVLMGDVAVPADLVHPHVTYLRATEQWPDQITEALIARVEEAESAGWNRAPVAEVVTGARDLTPVATVPVTFSRYAEQDATIRYMGEQFAAALPGLDQRRFVGTVHLGDSKISVRIEHRGDIVYALDVQRGGIGGDETVNFLVGRHDAGSACSNGWARPVYDTQTGTPVLELRDFSVLGRGSGEPRKYRKEDLFAALWQRINAVIAATVQ